MMKNNITTYTVKLNLDSTDFEKQLNSLIKNEGYKIVTKDNFVAYMLNNKPHSAFTTEHMKFIEQRWNSLRKGWNYVIQISDKEFVSPKYFNNVILGKLDNEIEVHSASEYLGYFNE